MKTPCNNSKLTYIMAPKYHLSNNFLFHSSEGYFKGRWVYFAVTQCKKNMSFEKTSNADAKGKITGIVGKVEKKKPRDVKTVAPALSPYRQLRLSNSSIFLILAHLVRLWQCEHVV